MEKKLQLLGLSQTSNLSGRLDAEAAAKILGFSEHDMPVLCRAKLLKPLGRPVPNAVKYYAATDIENYGRDVGWLNKATQAVYDYWKGKTDRKAANRDKVKESTGDEISLTA